MSDEFDYLDYEKKMVAALAKRLHKDPTVLKFPSDLSLADCKMVCKTMLHRLLANDIKEMRKENREMGI